MLARAFLIPEYKACTIWASLLNKAELPLLSHCQSCTVAAQPLWLWLTQHGSCTLHSICQLRSFFFIKESMCSSDGLSPFLLAAVGLSVAAAAACCMGFPCTLGHIQLWKTGLHGTCWGRGVRGWLMSQHKVTCRRSADPCFLWVTHKSPFCSFLPFLCFHTSVHLSS